ncbi:MAG TPA: FG-GAP-like repeat-containing protein [Gemmataceae bacterium]|nr:FG-GAP-like repeat-containing protein [Gemmataceae bacterium]
MPTAVALADLGNGHVDLVTSNSGDNTVSVLLGNGDGTFQAAQAFAVGSAPYGVAVADLGNGRADIVTANFGADTVSVLLGNGDGTFQPAQPFTVASAPVAVAVADLGNGRADIVTTNPSANTASVLLGNGDGTFQAAQTFVVGSNPYAVAVADLGNGRPDLVTANLGADTVSVLLGNGDGTFQPAQSFAVGGAPHSVAVADLGTGHPDLVTANPAADTVSVLLGNGDGTFQLAYSYAVGSEPYEVVVADLGNGRADIVTANFGSTSVSVLLGNGDGTFQPAQSFVVGDAPGSVAVADLGNGHPDIVTANAYDNTVSVLLGNGDGTFQPAQPYAVGFAPDWVTVADLGNGHADLVTTNQGDNTASVLLGNGDGTFQAAQPYAVGFAPNAVAVADLGNGRPDVVTANLADNTVSVLLGNGDGTFQPALSFGVASGPEEAAAADLGNGNADIVTTNFATNTVSVSLGNGDGTFQPAQSLAVGNGPSSLAVVDVNRDGRPDVVTANAIDDTVSVLLGNGDGTFRPAQSYAVGSDPTSVAVADLGNGRADIVTANYGDSTVSVLLGNGDGTFQPAQSFAVGSDPESVAVADLGNGHLDIITANNGANTVSVLLGNGDGTFQPAQSFAVGSDPESVAVVDLGNGHPDIVTANYGANTVSVLLGNGDGTFQPAQSFAVGSLPHSVAVADFGNGHPDIVTANYGDSTVSVLLGNGDGTFHPAQAFAVANEPESVAVADVNDDGRRDIVTSNAGISGTVSVLLNLGNGQFQAPAGPSGIPSRDVPQLQDLTGDGVPDAVSLDQNTGQVLFRLGTGDPSTPFAPLVVVNPGRPATDFTLVQTRGLPEIAALDSVDQQVFLYAWSSSASQFQQIGSFATGPQPVRIASADLDGNGLGDLVIGNDLDNTLTIALQQSPGIFDTFTRGVGAGPSRIAFADLNGDGPPDIVVSDQVSGDVSVLFNDAGHSFTTQERYRAGQDPFDVNIGANSTTLITQLQTVGVVAGDFTGPGSTDLVALNANIHSFSLLRAAGGGSLIDPQLADTYLVGPGAVQAVAGDFLHNGRQNLAVLTTAANGTSQVLIFLNNGDGTFTQGQEISAGNLATGLAVIPGSGAGLFDLLVGDQFGDILRLVGQGDGTFAPAPPVTGDRAPLDVIALGSAGRPQALVADQVTGQVTIQAPVSGGTQYATVEDLTDNPSPHLAPGAVYWAQLEGKAGPFDAVVVASGSNSVLIYHTTAVDPVTGTPTFAAPVSYPVGTDPVAVTIQDINGDGIPDMLVANKGSNDVSVLFGSIVDGQWVGTPGPRLKSGGSSPVAVTVVADPASPGGSDLVVTNGQSGTMSVLPGRGQGFFDDRPQSVTTFPIANTSIGAPSFFGPDLGFVVTGDGRLVGFNLADLAAGGNTLFAPGAGEGGVDAAEALAGGDVVAALAGGNVVDLAPTASGLGVALTFDPLSGIPSNPSALAVLQGESGPQVLVTNAGGDRVFVFGTPGVPESPALPGPEGPGVLALEVTSPAGAPLALVIALVAGPLPAPEGATPAAEAAAPAVNPAGGGDGPGGGEAVAWAPGEGGIDVEEQLRGIDLYRPPPDIDRDIPLSLRSRPGDAALTLLALSESPPPAAVQQLSAGRDVSVEVAWAASSPGGTAAGGAGVPVAAPTPGPVAASERNTSTAETRRATDAAFLLPPEAGEWGRPLLLAAIVTGSVLRPWREPRSEHQRLARRVPGRG